MPVVVAILLSVCSTFSLIQAATFRLRALILNDIVTHGLTLLG